VASKRHLVFTKTLLRLLKKSICGVALHLSSLRRTISTPHSSKFARLAPGAFYCVVFLWTFYESITFGSTQDSSAFGTLRDRQYRFHAPPCLPSRGFSWPRGIMVHRNIPQLFRRCYLGQLRPMVGRLILCCALQLEMHPIRPR